MRVDVDFARIFPGLWSGDCRWAVGPTPEKQHPPRPARLSEASQTPAPSILNPEPIPSFPPAPEDELASAPLFALLPPAPPATLRDAR